MQSIQHRICPIDTISQSKIESSVRISSLNEIVIELVKNALDANAKSIDILLNFSTGFCSVQDDGEGIAAQEFGPEGRLAEIHCMWHNGFLEAITDQIGTSKLYGSPNLYGRNGRYLAAVAGVALLSVSSQDKDGLLHTLWVNETGRLGHYVEEKNDWHALHGTRVRVYNLFSKFPVRRKHLVSRFFSKAEVVKELDKLRYQLTGLMFAFPGTFNVDVQHTEPLIRFRYKNSKQNIDLIDCQHVNRDLGVICSLLHRFGYVDQSQPTGWQSISLTSQDIDLEVALSSSPSPHKLVQFISINHNSLNKQACPELFDVVNSIFDLSSFGSLGSEGNRVGELRTDDNSQSLHSRHITACRKGIDRWPMFVIWIDTKRPTIEILYTGDKPVEDVANISPRVSPLLQTLITEFLINHGFSFSSKAKQRSHNTSERVSSPHLLPVAHQACSSFELRNMSRIQSGSEFAFDDILSGLPFKVSENQENFKSSKSLTLQNTELPAISELPYRARKRLPSTNSDDMDWIDPQTGDIIRLDSRTGIALPESDTTSINCQVLAHRQKRQKPLPFTQVAENAKRYLRGFSNNSEKPIRSIALSGNTRPAMEMVWHANDKHAKRFGQSNAACSLSEDENLHVPNLSRAALAKLVVLGQVDKKFILVTAPDDTSASSRTSSREHQLVLIDQHAADERVKIEQLICSFYDEVVTLDTPIVFETSSREASLLNNHKSDFRRLHVFYEVSQSYEKSSIEGNAEVPTLQVHITALPEVIAERCRLQPKLVIDLLREEIWSDSETSTLWRTRRAKVLESRDTVHSSRNNRRHISIASTFPLRLLGLLNSRACRSAIMFNDELTHSQCTSLVRSLTACTLPFQCAHGRPSMVMLMNMSSLAVDNPLARNDIGLHSLGIAASGTPSLDWQNRGLNVVDDVQSFGSAYRSWIERKDSRIELTAEQSPA